MLLSGSAAFSLDPSEAATVLANWSRIKISPSAADRKQPGEKVPAGQSAVG